MQKQNISMKATNIHTTFDRLLQRSDKEKMLNQKACCLWMTGLSGSGKTTIAQGLEKKLHAAGYLTQVLDGDNIRSGINNNLGFSLEDRQENIRRIAEVTKLYINSGLITINCFVSPTIEIRAMAKSIIGDADMLEIFVNTPLEICEARDVKGLYKKARAGEIKNFTGIDSPFEAPENPAFNLETANKTIEESVNLLFDFVIKKIKLNN